MPGGRVCAGLVLALAGCSAERPPPAVGRQALDGRRALAEVTGSVPFLGWSSWSVESSTNGGYGTKWLGEGNVKNASDAMQAKLGSAGYSNVDIDAGWNATLAWHAYGYDAHGVPLP